MFFVREFFIRKKIMEKIIQNFHGKIFVGNHLLPNKHKNHKQIPIEKCSLIHWLEPQPTFF